jgi:hypothetical protein
LPTALFLLQNIHLMPLIPSPPSAQASQIDFGWKEVKPQFCTSDGCLMEALVGPIAMKLKINRRPNILVKVFLLITTHSVSGLGRHVSSYCCSLTCYLWFSCNNCSHEFGRLYLDMPVMSIPSVNTFRRLIRVTVSAFVVLSLSACSSQVLRQSQPSTSASADPVGILSRLQAIQSDWAIDEANNLSNHSIAVYASPGNQGCFVWVFNHKNDAEQFGSEAVTNAQSAPMYWSGKDKVSKKELVLLSMGGVYFSNTANSNKCESAMESAFNIQMLSSVD